MITQLKPCRWRAMLPTEGRISCSSTRLTGSKIDIPITTCERCPYTDHTPIGTTIPWEPCEYRSSKRVHLPIAPDNVRDWRTCEHPQKPLGEVVCQCRGCSPQCSGYVAGDEYQQRPAPDDFVAPLTSSGKWMGRPTALGKTSPVTVVICHLNTIDDLVLGVEMWREQTVKPYIIIVDTGSPSALHQRLEQLRDDDCEIQYVRTSHYIHSSAPVGVAMDLAFTLCPTEFLFSTHSDVFPRRTDFLQWMMSQCGEKKPVVGWQMSPRDTIPRELWERCVSHTATIWYVPRMRKIGLRWDFRWWFAFTGETARPGWPDTESPPNLCLEQAGIAPILLGTEPNHELHETEWYWHARSQASVRTYGNDNALCRKIHAYGAEARQRAGELLDQWRKKS